MVSLKAGWMCIALVGWFAYSIPEAIADRCVSGNSLEICACNGTCQKDDNSCRCADPNDHGAGGLVCVSKDGTKTMTCQKICERSDNDARCDNSVSTNQ